MQITLLREKRPERYAPQWRRPVFSLSQRESIESVRRKTNDATVPDKKIRRDKEVQLSHVDWLLAGSGRRFTRARIENIYQPGEFDDNYVYDSQIGAFVHESMVQRCEKIASQIGAGAIISEAVTIDDEAQIGAYTEIEKSVHLRAGSVVGSSSIVRKNAQVGERSMVGSWSYIGQSTQILDDVTIGAHSVLGRHVMVGDYAALGQQNRLGVSTHVGSKVWLDDSVRSGRYVNFGTEASVGEMTTIGSYSHIGEQALIGAESHLGRFVRVGRRVMLISPTYAEDGATLLTSTLGLRLKND